MVVPICLSKLFKNTKTDKIGNHISKVVSSPLTLNPNYVATQEGGSNTLFEEIVAMSYEEVLPPLYLKKLLELKPNSNRVPLSAFMETFIKTLTGYIEKVWQPNKFNVVLHSGGWDSRILSAILRRIYVKRGADFGRILFACYGEECSVLQKIMEIEGWSKNQYVSIPRDDKFFSHHFDFQKAWWFLNGPSPYPVNDLFWVYKFLSSNGRIPRDPSKIQFWSAIYFNEVFLHLHSGKSNPVELFINKYYNFWATNLISGLPFVFSEPVLNYKTLKCIVESRVDLPKDIRARIMRKINPELCKVPRRTNPQKIKLPTKHRLKVEKDYSTSWYGKNIRPNIKRDMKIVHSPWWSAWSSASLVGYLIQKGIKIIG